MKRILIIIGSLKIGGAEKVMVDLVRYIERSDKEITFLVFDKKMEKYEKEVHEIGCNVVHIKHSLLPYTYYKRLKKVNDEYGPFDVCHSCTLLNSGLNLALFYRIGCPIRISHSHSTNSGRKDSFVVRIYEKCMKKLILKYTTNYLACGKDAGDYLYGKEVFSEKGIVINNGIDFTLYSFNREKRNLLRKEMGLLGKIVIGNVARLVKLKNQEFLIDIMEVLVKKEPQCVLILVGDGEEKENIEKKVKSKKLERYVRLLGARDDVYNILNSMDLFVLPSLYEGFPLSLIEAQVNGLPVVVSDKVTKEVKLSDGCHFLSLDEDVVKWADMFLKYAKKEREPVELTSLYNKYDINICARKLEREYYK